MRWPLQPLQPLQQTQLQPLFGQSVDSLCHPWFTTTNVSYRFPILKLPPPPCAVLLVQHKDTQQFLNLFTWAFQTALLQLSGWCLHFETFCFGFVACLDFSLLKNEQKYVKKEENRHRFCWRWSTPTWYYKMCMKNIVLALVDHNIKLMLAA